jgi:glycosyltransferase involved in cell wall biosynthesis
VLQRVAPSENDPTARARRKPRSSTSKSNRRQRPYIAEERAAALEAFRRAHGPDFAFASIVVVIAAFNEEESLGEVLDLIPATVDGHDVDTLVIDDGSVDATSVVAAKRDDVKVVRLRRNCGHGVALRVGYRLAYEYGAKCIVTLDADMQWDPRDMPALLPPLLNDEADFVLGSRVLGSTETTDRFRQAGVHVFARLVSLLTGVKVTDTSSGYRVMRPEITQTVEQTQVQYQTSELLIGAICQGYRIVERPVTMHQRFAGESKKGTDLFYGLRYARVILSTWRRERRKARRAPRAAPR